MLVDGFFPVVGADERPRGARRVGLAELGLPVRARSRRSRATSPGFLARQREVAPAGRAPCCSTAA